MRNGSGALAILIVVTSSLICGFLGGRMATGPVPPRPDEFPGSFIEALDVIQRNYVDKIEADRLFYSAIKGMLHALDPHSSFFDPREFARLREEQRSSYFGVGANVRRLRRDSGRVVIIEPPVPESPAARSGLRAGDVITHIGGEAIDNLTRDEVVDRLHGPHGSWVTITAERLGVRNPLQFKVERDEIPIPSVPHAFEVSPGTGYIKIDRFSESTAAELNQKLESLAPARLSGLILDLRNNPGGLLSQAIDVADLFLARGQMIVSTKGRARSSAKIYRAPSRGRIRIPVVVLINGQSASASEIVAGALQDHDRALILGETSFGKALVQSVYSLGNVTGMALTTARYYTPSGRQIQRDYSGTLLDYYYLGGGLARAGEPREVRQTDSGRKVLGGGGITPDLEVPDRKLNHFETLLSSQYIFFEYALRLASGQTAAAGNFRLPLNRAEVRPRPDRSPVPIPDPEITDAILTDFKDYLRSRNIEFKEDDIQENIDFIKRGIKQEVYTSAFGRLAGVKIAIQADNQVKKAIELLPEASLLMTTGHTSLRALQK